MSKRKIEFFVVDAYISILKIEDYIKDKNDANDLLYDYKSWDATIRELEIVGESIKHLIMQDIFDNEKRKIVDFRNLLIHEYFGIDRDIVWDVLQNKIPFLKEELRKIILQFSNKKEILNFFIEDNYFISFIVDELERLKE